MYSVWILVKGTVVADSVIFCLFLSSEDIQIRPSRARLQKVPNTVHSAYRVNRTKTRSDRSKEGTDPNTVFSLYVRNIVVWLFMQQISCFFPPEHTRSGAQRAKYLAEYTRHATYRLEVLGIVVLEHSDVCAGSPTPANDRHVVEAVANDQCALN